jgi:hypothetical protein
MASIWRMTYPACYDPLPGRRLEREKAIDRGKILVIILAFSISGGKSRAKEARIAQEEDRGVCKEAGTG